MDSQDLRAQSAALFFNVSGSRITVLMRAFGNPENVRKALRAACSHRRSIVVTRPATFVGNAYIQLAKKAQDVAELLTFDNDPNCWERNREAFEWNYVIQPRGAQGAFYIKFLQRGASPVEQPLMSFIGTEYRREYVETEARKRALKGRPKEHYLRNGMWRKIANLTPAQRERYERLEKARAAKGHGAAAKHQATTTANTAVAQNGDTLGLKDKPRKIKVDFTGVVMPNKAWGETLLSMDQAIADLDGSPEERAEGFAP